MFACVLLGAVAQANMAYSLFNTYGWALKPNSARHAIQPVFANTYRWWSILFTIAQDSHMGR